MFGLMRASVPIRWLHRSQCGPSERLIADRLQTQTGSLFDNSRGAL